MATNKEQRIKLFRAVSGGLDLCPADTEDLTRRGWTFRNPHTEDRWIGFNQACDVYEGATVSGLAEDFV